MPSRGRSASPPTLRSTGCVGSPQPTSTARRLSGGAGSLGRGPRSTFVTRRVGSQSGKARSSCCATSSTGRALTRRRAQLTPGRALQLGLILTTGLSGFTAAAEQYVSGPVGGPVLRVAAQLLAVALNLVLFVVSFRVLTAREVTVRQVWVGAVIAALGAMRVSRGVARRAAWAVGGGEIAGGLRVRSSGLMWRYRPAGAVRGCCLRPAWLGRRLRRHGRCA